ncbi:MAG: oxidoreductase [Pseudomonadota bacterium]
MSTSQLHPVHDGERLVQNRRGTPPQLADQLPLYIEKYMPFQHADFYTGLPYIALGALDAAGRPWVSLLVTRAEDDPSVGIRLLAVNELGIVSRTTQDDPFVRALAQSDSSASGKPALFAGVGVDFTNRRRNKLAGSVKGFDANQPGSFKLHLRSDQHLGNCPKYITVRNLIPHARTPTVALDHFEGLDQPLNEECKSLINSASTVFIATKHQPLVESEDTDERDMGVNHRGGAPGFLRMYEEAVPGKDVADTYLILPDHSGNRFYQSLGNIESDGLIGMTVPNFESGDVLYVTGEAENLFDEEAEAIMPRVKLVTRIRVTGAMLINQALSLKLVSEEQYSPYNPPVRLLRSELSNTLGVTDHDAAGLDTEANLVSTKKHSSTLTTFRFELSKPITPPLPGGFGIFDFSDSFERVYKHMDEANPQAVNDDHVRTWTLSGAAKFDPAKKQFKQTDHVEITVKRKEGGLISNYLHGRDSTSFDTENTMPMSAGFLGSGGDFSCFNRSANSGLLTVHAQMLWVAGGAGITPFMSMFDGLVQMNEELAKTEEQHSTNIVLYFAGRGDDLNIIHHFLDENKLRGSGASLQVSCFRSPNASDDLSTQASDSMLNIKERRIEASDFSSIEDLRDREVFVCGPVAFMQHVGSALESAAGEDLKIHQESYAF